MNLVNLILAKRILLLIFVVFLSRPIYAQTKENQDEYIENKLQQIDSLISMGRFEQADFLIRNTLNTFSFSKNSKEKLSLEFRTAKNYYQQGHKERAMEKLLDGLERLKGNPFSKLNIEYANLLARIFADSQNFDKAIFYNKIALQKARLIKDTVAITKSLIRLGSFYYAKNEEDSAKAFFRKVTYYPVSPKTETRIANAYNNLGVIAQNNDNFDLAKHWAKEALKLKIKQNDVVGIAYSNVNLGNLISL